MTGPRLALVPGEPAGVGPELTVRALARDFDAELTVFGDRALLQRAAETIDLELRKASFVEIPHPHPVQFGEADPRNAASVVEALTRAAQGCIDGEFDGLVTGPVHKGTINDAGIAFTGSTELLARHAGRDVVMMLANEQMRVALATTHLPLREVADAITAEGLAAHLRILHAALLRDFGVEEPVIAVLGLNPHSGEGGHLGREEIETINPVVKALREEGMRLSGPLPADTAFLPGKLEGFDAVFAMYHDQGLPVLKYSGFEKAVNLTLGLPYPRVAVDHGTALELAGKGVASPSSLVAAIRTCTRMANARARQAKKDREKQRDEG